MLTGRPLHVALPAEQYGARVLSDISKQTISDAEGRGEVKRRGAQAHFIDP